MYKINNLSLPIDFDKANLSAFVSQKLKLDVAKISDAKLNKLSCDARKKSDIRYVASIIFNYNGKINNKNVEIFEERKYKQKTWQREKKKIVIVGSGPSGLFAALTLVNAGCPVVILERGYDMAKRKIAVDNLFNNGVLDEKSNIQFGEGGAGTFSDGKLNTGIKSEYIQEVLDTFYKFGADEDVLYNAKPHIGTDILSKIIVNIREYLISKGSEFRFETKLCGINVSNENLKSIDVINEKSMKENIVCDILILAIGHSSRDTIRMLKSNSLALKQKSFSMGFRVEHLQKDVGYCQYGDKYRQLPTADYKVWEHLDNGRTIYSFCMCPGGVVVPAMSEKDTVVTNGMSYHARDGVNANSAVLVNVNPEDFPSSDVLSGIELQEKYEKLAYAKTGSYKAVVQRVGDFLSGVPTVKLGKVIPTYKPGYVLGDLSNSLPEYIIQSIKKGIPKIAGKVKFFEDKDAILTGVETRSSAPYQVIRDADMQTNLQGVYMIGEGAGFAGGIVSSAVEGIKVGNILIDKFGG